MMNKLLKIGCLAIYLLAITGLFIPLPFSTETPLRYMALILLAVHLLEVPIMFRYVRRYPGSLAVSLLLTLLFGFLHWWPLRQPWQSELQ